MAYEFRFPDVGEGIVEGEIVEWKVSPGDTVAAHQTLVVMETDKAVVEIPSPVAGRILTLHGEPGEVVGVGAVLAVIATGGEAAELPKLDSGTLPRSGPTSEAGIPIPGGRPRSRPAGPAAPIPVSRGSVGVVGELEEAPDEEPVVSLGESGPQLSVPRSLVLPRDRLLARQLGVEPDGLRGTGPSGRVTEGDIRRAAERGAPGRRVSSAEGVASRDECGPVERVALRGVRRKVAEAMVRSLATAAQVTTTDEARVGLLWHILEKERGAAAEQGTHLTLLAFVAKAVVSALKRDPWLNAALDAERGEVILKGYYHVGVATETRDGLLVPVIRDVDRKTVLEVARDIQDLSSRARARTLGVEQLRGSTFTLSNYGSIGGRFATPILNPPEVGLLGLGRVAEQPVVSEGALKVEKVLPLSLTFDHRVVDGATAQHFLRNVVRNLEDPDRFLLGV